VILYFLNKSERTRSFNVRYTFEAEYYEIKVTEKVEEIKPMKQAREVVEVRLQV
jgi:hypothetical protein